MCGGGEAFDSHAQTAKVFHICMSGFEQAFLQGFDHKNVPAVLGIYPGFAKRKVNSSAVLWSHRGYGYKRLVHYIRIVQSIARLK